MIFYMKEFLEGRIVDILGLIEFVEEDLEIILCFFDFDLDRYKVFNFEFKFLYMVIICVRVNVWFFDEDEEIWVLVFEYF